MLDQSAPAGHQKQQAAAVTAGAGIVLDLGLQVYNVFEIHDLKKVDKLKNIVSTVASEVMLHDDLTALAKLTNRAFTKLTSLIRHLEMLLQGTVATLFQAMQ